MEAAKPQGLGQLAQGLMMLTTCRIILGSSQDQFRIIYKLYFILYKRLLGNNNHNNNNNNNNNNINIDESITGPVYAIVT